MGAHEPSRKVAVVTGAARGIGRASAVALATSGFDVAGIDIAGPVSNIPDLVPSSRADLDETGRKVAEAGARWLPLVLDQRDIVALRKGFATIVETFGGIDVVHANAGIQAFVPLLDMSDADWSDQIDVNLTGTANVIRVAAPLLKERGGGRIIITSSTQGQHGTLDGAAYSASKWGLLGLIKSAALELGAYGITVNAVVPGLIDTPLTRRESRYEQALESSGKTASGDERRDEEQAEQGLASKSPLGVPWIEPEDIAPAVVFLASDGARMVSGTSIAVTGGDSANITA
ncbi:SDR family NAD(P)-dependent oxidoreductase [Gordonia aichiensis]